MMVTVRVADPGLVATGHRRSPCKRAAGEEKNRPETPISLKNQVPLTRIGRTNRREFVGSRLVGQQPLASLAALPGAAPFSCCLSSPSTNFEVGCAVLSGKVMVALVCVRPAGLCLVLTMVLNSVALMYKSLAAVPFGERERMRKCGFDDRETIVRRAQQLAEQRRRALRAGSGTARRKNAPREMSSKVPVGRLREVVLPEEMRQRVHRKPSRDPRFSDLSGRLNKDLFDKSYAFLEDHRKDDIAQLRQLLRDSKDERKRRIAQQQLNRLQQQQQQHVRDSARKELKRKRRAQEGEAVTQGKQPFFLKENERRKLEVQERYESLKEQGKLQKYMTKKRKRNAAKERKRMPEMGRRDQS